MNEIKTQKKIKLLPCRLTDDEVRLRGIDLANANNQYANTKAEAKESAKEYRDQLEEINDNIHQLKDTVRTGVEVRDVECEVRIDTYLGNVTITRLDTNMVIENRTLEPHELKQPGLFDDGEES